MTQPYFVVLNVKFDLNLVRPKNPALCNDKQFEIFREAFLHVQYHQEDLIPLHAAIRESLERFHDGDFSLEDLTEDLCNIAMSAHLLTGSELASGRISYEWEPTYLEKNKDTEEMELFYTQPPWLAHFVYACHGFTKYEYGADFYTQGLMETPRGLKRVEAMKNWALTIRDIGAQALKSLDLPAPECRIEVIHFPLHVVFSCTNAGHENQKLTFRITENPKHDTFIIELEWESGQDWPLMEFEIPHLLAFANRRDEAMVEDVKDAKPVYRLKIVRLGQAAA